MPRTKKPYISFQTKEEFDKAFHEMYQAGYEDGFNRGKVNGLAHVLVGIKDQFDSNIIDEASLLINKIQINQWKRQSKYIEGAKKLAVKEYIERK